jgi:hypothetical protein
MNILCTIKGVRVTRMWDEREQRIIRRRMAWRRLLEAIGILIHG